MDPFELVEPALLRGLELVLGHGGTGERAGVAELRFGHAAVAAKGAVAIPTDEFKVFCRKDHDGDAFACIDGDE